MSPVTRLLHPFATVSPSLVGIFLAMLVLAAVAVAGLFLDPRLITGAPGRLKPLKFAVSTAIYALTKSGVVTLTESLYAQLLSVGAAVSASVLFPGPNVLRTGLFSSARNRPDVLKDPDRPSRPPGSIESFEKALADRGIVLDYTPVEDVAALVVDAVRTDQFWILPPSERTDDQIRARSESMLARSNPTYIRDLGA